MQACGCTTDVTDENVEEGEVDKLVKGLVQQVSQVSHTYASSQLVYTLSCCADQSCARPIV